MIRNPIVGPIKTIPEPQAVDHLQDSFELEPVFLILPWLILFRETKKGYQVDASF